MRSAEPVVTSLRGPPSSLRARCLEPEWLDLLPADDPRAERSRRDLRRVNAWMGNARILERLLAAHCRAAPRSLTDLGGGDGQLLLELAMRLARRWPRVAATLVDRQSIVGERTAARVRSLGWDIEAVAADALEYVHDAQPARPAVVIANLFLHHLAETDLTRLLARLATLEVVFIACEPRRSSLGMVGSRMLWAIGCNQVSRHDAIVSVRAGFSGKELSALWPSASGWRLSEAPAGLFSHTFVACPTPRRCIE
jgi:hypothetical protein